MRLLPGLWAACPLLAAQLVFSAGWLSIPAMLPLEDNGAPNATFEQRPAPDQLVPGWTITPGDEFARFGLRTDGPRQAFEAWPRYLGWPSNVRMVSSLFELSAACPRLAFTARADAPGDGLEVLLVGQKSERFLGRYVLGAAWQTVDLPAVPDLAGQEVHIEARVFTSSQVQLRSLGAPAC